ncbi:MAG: class I SAM-dependent methyltransferase [Acidimicrobiia bacterium]
MPSEEAGAAAGLTQLRRALLARSSAMPVPFVVRAGGESLAMGDGDPAFEVSILTPAGMAAVLSLRELAIAEAYMAGDIDFAGDLFAVMGLRDVLVDRELSVKAWAWLKPWLVGRRQCNPGWIAQHYDAGNIQLLAADSRWHTYTPGIYEDDGDSMECGATRKLEAAFEALRLGPGATLLDVGCGWGGFVRYCAERDVHVTGITLSRHQLDFTRELLREEKLDADLSYQDFFSYRPGRRFDAISLMGVLEDLSRYRAVAGRLARWVEPDGRCYADFASTRVPFGVSSFITKYVWPGEFRMVYLPALMRALAHSSLEVVEMRNDRRNYRLWVRKVHDHWVEQREAVLQVADERTWRMFRLLHAGVAATMDDSTERATAYRLVFAPRRAG